VNWFLMLACIGLVIWFGSSTNLAAAYGIAVTMTMLITTILFFFVARRLWHWKAVTAALVCAPLFVVELAFFTANALKIAHGGWFPLAMGIVIFTLLTTWKSGRRLLAQKLERSTLPLSLFMKDVVDNPPRRVHGTAIYLAGRLGSPPIALLHNIKHNKVLHDRVIFLTVIAHEQPRIEEDRRVDVEHLQQGFDRVVGHYGFMEEPDVPGLLERCKAKGLDLNPQQCSYFLSRETLIPTPARGMVLWRDMLFVMMSKNATSAASFFKLPPNQVVELGMQIEI
jgi:KUP system potassium uptake protein